MKKIIPFSFLLLFANTLFAQQPCNDEIIMNTKGAWKKVSDANMKAGNQAQIITRIDKMALLFQEAYPQPAGMDAKWYRSIQGNAIVNNGAVPYQFNSLYKAWYCNQNLHKLLLGSETGTWAYVFVNDLHWFISEVAGIKIDAITAYFLPVKTGQWKGMTLYDRGSTQFDEHRAVLITRGNQLPYTPVSRRQYLKALKQNLENDKIIQIDINNKMTVRSDAEEEAARQKGMEAYAKSFRPERMEKAKENYLKNYKTDKERKEEHLQRIEKDHAGKMKVIEDVWKSYNNNELEQAAIIEPFRTFKEFSTEDKGGRIMVLLNNNYFNMQLPRYIPQLMVLYWRSESNNNAPSQFFKKEFEANFPVEKLRLMLDK